MRLVLRQPAVGARHVRPRHNFYRRREACVNSEPIKDTAVECAKLLKDCCRWYVLYDVRRRRRDVTTPPPKYVCVSGRRRANVPFALAMLRLPSSFSLLQHGSAQKNSAPWRRRRERAAPRQQVTQMIRIIYLAAAGGVNLWSAARRRSLSLSIRYESPEQMPRSQREPSCCSSANEDYDFCVEWIAIWSTSNCLLLGLLRMKAQEMQLCFCTLNRVAMLKKQTDLFAFYSIEIL